MKRFAVIAAFAVGLPLGAFAQESGAYVRGFIGTPFLGSAGIKAPPAGTYNDPNCENPATALLACPTGGLRGALDSPGDVNAFSGIDFGAAVGWRLNSQFRGELAFDYRTISLDIPTAMTLDANGNALSPPVGIFGSPGADQGNPLTSATGDNTFWSIMVNGIYDIQFDPGQIVNPYVGVGAGWGNATVKAYNLGTDASTPTNGINDKTASGIAFNLLAGLGYEFADGISGTLEYKYTNMLETEIDGISGTDVVKYKVAHQDHLVTVGIAYDFGGGGYSRTPPPPPAPLPPPRPVAPPPPPVPVINCADQDQSVVVYFGLNKVALAQEDVDSIGNAVRAASRNTCSVSDVSIVGYTDRSGNAAYNKKLSERRGDAVRQVVIDFGISPALIEVTGAGELDAARPAEDGKVDALSRRAEIYIRAE